MEKCIANGLWLLFFFSYGVMVLLLFFCNGLLIDAEVAGTNAMLGYSPNSQREREGDREGAQVLPDASKSMTLHKV